MYKTLILFTALILLSGCKTLRPYCVDVQQGNIIDKNTMAQLHVGMDKNAVKSVIGTPLLDDMFNTNTWTYVHTNQVNDGELEKQKLVLEFRENKLAKINLSP